MRANGRYATVVLEGDGDASPCWCFAAQRAQRLGHGITSAPAVAIAMRVDEPLSHPCRDDRAECRRVARFMQGKALVARLAKQARRRRSECQPVVNDTAG